MKLAEKYILCIRKKSTPRTFYRIVLARQDSLSKYKLLRYRYKGNWCQYPKGYRDTSYYTLSNSYNIIEDIDIKKVFEASL